MSIEILFAGFLFLFIIVTITASSQLGNKITFGGNDLDPDAKLQGIIDNPKRFRMSVYLALVEHGAIIALAIVMFVVFSPYSLILGSVWLIARTVEGLINYSNQKDYWELLDLSRQYSGASGDEKEAMSDSCRTIVETKNHRFSFAQVLFSIGTLSYSIVFVISGDILSIIGWFGIVASILYGLGNGIVFAKPKNQVLALFGGLLIFIFEAVLGVWLVYSGLFIL
ncbi:MAG: DUF4386 domain-containing protein [Candidatus Thorarchaeota archaeon]|jgi:hypothetical protein